MILNCNREKTGGGRKVSGTTDLSLRPALTKNGARQVSTRVLIQLPTSCLFIVDLIHLTPFDREIFVGFIPERIPIFYYPQGDCLILESPEGAAAPDGC
jgi:hypothetical protein